MSGWPRRGGWRERPLRPMRHGSRGRRGRRRPGRRVGEGGSAPPRLVALDREHHLANARSKVGAETTAQLVWILAPRLPEPQDRPRPDG